jgi:uncharacterized membrane protein YeiH
VLLFDAAGLSFFAVAGTQKAVEFGLLTSRQVRRQIC